MAQEAYAELSTSETTFTFYYDNQRTSRTGTTYDLNTGSNVPGWYTDDSRANVTTVVFDSSFANARPTSTYYWFLSMENLTTITGMNYLNTSNVTDMSFMFYNCSALTSLDVSNFNTAKVTSMTCMFYDCSSLTSLDVSNFNTAKVTSMTGMFKGCSSLTSLDVSNFNTANVTHMEFMFFNCRGLTRLDLSNFNTAKVTEMTSMFQNCSNLTTIYAGNGWSTDAVSISSNMFDFCLFIVGGQGTTYDANHIDKTYARIDGGTARPGYFTEISAPVPYAEYTSDNTTLTFYYDKLRYTRTGMTYNLNTGSDYPGWHKDNTNAHVTKVVFDPSFADARPTTTARWFLHMTLLTDITGLEYLNTSSVTSMQSMFHDCWSLPFLDLSGFSTAAVTDMYAMFESCRELTTIIVGSNWTTTNVQNENMMFYDCAKLVGGAGTTYDPNHYTLDYAHVDGGSANPGYFTDTSDRQPYAALSDNNTKLTFYCDGLKNFRSSLDLNTGDNEPAWIGANLVTTVVFDASFAAARPTSTYHWFKNKPQLTSITGLEYLNTSQVTNMESMFDMCATLNSLDVSGFNTASVTKMRNMFSNCAELTSLNVKDWDTGNVTDMYGMFSGCTHLASLNVSNWNTGKVANMQNMFANCSALASLDVSEWNTASVTNMLSMFENCSSLTNLDLNSWNTGNVDLMYNMFKGCSNLARLKVSNWNTSKVTDMGSMFNGCSKLTTLDLSGWNTALVRNMSGMFAYCSSLRTISVGNNWSTSSVSTSDYMFLSCNNLVGGAGTTYSSSHQDAGYAHLDGGTSNPGYLSGLPYAVFNSINEQLTFYFDGNQGSYGGGSSTVYYVNNDAVYPSWLEKKAAIKYVNFDASFAYARPTRTSYWFDEMTNLVSISNIENLNTSEVTTMSGMFYNCSSLKNLDLSSFDTGNVTDMSGMFTGCSSLINLNVSNWNTSNVTNMSQLFFNCSSLATLDLSGWNTGNIGYISTMFSGCSSLTTIYAGSGWNVESVENSQNMFKDCTSLVGGAGTTFDAGKTDKTYARIDGVNGKKGYLSANPYAFLSSDNKTLTFYCDGKRTEREATGTVYNLNTENHDPGWYDKRTSVTTVVFDASFAQARPTSTYNWFRGMSNLTTITNIRKLNTSSVTNMRYMFSACAKLTSLDLSSFNTENVTDMYGLFYNSTGLTSVDVSSFNTANVTLMTNMFWYCSKLTSLDLGSFNTANVTSMYGMFEGCSSLKTVFVSGSWNTDAVTSSTNMFKNCTSLEGGGGTTFDSGKTDKAYAHIDGGATNPGYFTATPYVVVSNNGKTLTFYNDGMPKGTYDGTYYNLNTVESLPGWLIATDITTVVFDASFGGARPTTTNYWFYNLQNLETITGMEYLNTSEVTNMNAMFQNCQKLTSLNLSKWNTSKVTNMNAMFYGCSALVSILVGDGWNTDNVTESDQMFSDCTNLKGGAGTTYDENHVDKAYAIVDGTDGNPGYLSGEPYARYGIYSHELYFSCDGRRSYYENDSGYNVYDLNTGTTQPGWYDKHAEVATVRFEWTFAAARPTSTFAWFKGMTNIVGIDGLEYLNTSEVTRMDQMFYDCSQLATLDLSGFNTAKVNVMDNMFKNCSTLTILDLSSFSSSWIFTNYMFQNCSSLTTIYVGSGWSQTTLSNSTDMFDGCTNLVGGAGTAYNDANPKDKTYAHVDGGTSNPGYLTDISAREGYAVYTADNTTLTFYFDGKRSSRTGTTYDLNTGNSEPAWYYANYEYGIYEDVTNVVFNSSFAEARPTSTSNWFLEMENLTTITGIEYLNTSEVTTMAGMFSTCSNLTSLDLSHFDTGNVTDMTSMFDYCINLTSLDLSHFDTSKVTDMAFMFNHCSGLTTLDLSSFNTANVTNMASMFNTCSNLTTIIVGEGWDTEKVRTSGDMFIDCRNLKGSAGTAYNDENPVDKTYARIDGGTVSPGYLTSLPYVVLNTETQTITYYSDGKKGTHTAENELTCNLNGEDFELAWMEFQQMNYDKIKYAVIDPSFAAARITSMRGWFGGFYELESITGLEYLNTSAVTNMASMFDGCLKLASLDLSHFDTSNVTDMSGMFSACRSLTSLDVSGFNTENVTDMRSMFSSCTGLTSLYLGSFNTSKVTIMTSMFSGCSNLTTIYVDEDNWSTSSVPYLSNGQFMFNGCTKLVGGNGTRFSADHVDYDYAHIDAAGNPGYLTAASQIQTEAYAVYTEDNTTLTFYYDKLRLTRTNRTFDLNTYSNEPDWVHEGWNAPVTNVVFDPSFATARPTTTYEWFRDMTNLTTITGIEYLNTSEVTSMAIMFLNCSSLTTLDVSSFNTAKVTSMRWMFWGCSSLTTLDLSTFNTENVTDMRDIFYGCSSLESLDLSSFNTQNVTDMFGMFWGCSSLTTLDLSTFNTENVTDMGYMFSGCSSLESLNVSSFNTANVTNMTDMFTDCSALTTLDLSHFDTGKVTDMSNMFYWCIGLTSLNLSNWNTANVTNMSFMFSTCNQLTTLDLSSFNTANVTNMNSMFSYCKTLTTIYVGDGWNTDAVTSSYWMFTGCKVLVGGNGTAYSENHQDAEYAHIDVAGNPGYFTEKLVPYAVLSTDETTLTFYYDGMKDSREGMKFDIPWEGYPDWTNSDANPITTVDFDESFADYDDLNSTYGMFYRLQNLTTINNLDRLNTEEVTTMELMFSSCSNLESVDVSHFNTEKVTNMRRMFSYCGSLEELDLLNFNTEQVTDMNGMFNACSSLTELNLSNFNTEQVTDMYWMFHYCTKLTTINVGDGWSTDAVTSSNDMFLDSPALVGGQGTTYDADHVDAEYAHVDGGASNPGYFTDKPAEAYAVYTDDNTTLTFYFDNQRSSRTGTTYDLNTGSNVPDWKTIQASVTNVVFDSSFADARPTTTYLWFWGMQELTTFTGMENLNTSEVTNMYGMFMSCWSLETLDLSNFNTAKVTNMDWMLSCCKSLTTIYVGDGWSTSAVTISDYMFSGSSSLVGDKGTTYSEEHVNKGYAHIDGGASYPGYFSEPPVVPYAVLSTDGTTLTFYYDSMKSKREGKKYNVPNGEYAPDWFWANGEDNPKANIETVVFDESFAEVRPHYTYCWFGGMNKLSTITGLEYLNTSEVTNMGQMFRDCGSLTSLDLSNFDTKNVTNMAAMFRFCSSLVTVEVSQKWSTANVTESDIMFESCTSIVGGNGTTFDENHIDKAYAHVDGGPSDPGYFTEKPIEIYAVISTDGKTLSFYYDSMKSKREGTKYNVPNGNYSPDWYFDNAYSNIETAVFDESFADVRPHYTCCWFGGMSNLTTITGLEYLNTSEVTNMSQMFFDCGSLTSLDLSGFDTKNVTNMVAMFRSCSRLVTVEVSQKWSTANVTLSNNMFDNCTSIVGGNGTTFDENHIDKEYAHVDGGTSDPGYFTYKASVLLGDVNGDGKVDVADVTALTNHLLGTGGSYNEQAADVDGSGGVNRDDISALVQLVLGQ
ncbi:MAG: BspA family leucine-rich repeat surface protein [Prevotella sp.]|nr:BspA family leucine-rich repeat surface protein [Prevotella sp.]